MIKQIIVCFDNKKYNINLNLNNCYDYETKTLFEYLKKTILERIDINIDINDLFIIERKTNNLVNYKNIEDILKTNTKIVLDIILKLKGGIIDKIVNTLRGIIKMFASLGKIMETFFRLFINVMELIPVIFDPPRLIDDIMFAVTFGINRVFNIAKESASGAFSSPEDDKKPKGPFGVDDDVSTTCIDPTFSTILLLIICPPLAIFYKLGFWKGFISAIICGVLCVKLFYFPGLLFAILHVLC